MKKRTNSKKEKKELQIKSSKNESREISRLKSLSGDIIAASSSPGLRSTTVAAIPPEVETRK